MANFLLSATDAIKSQFKVKEVNSTNTTFKLFSNITFGICIFASILVATSEYLGSPINCSQGTAKVVDGSVFNAHCWIHGTKHVPEKFQEEFDCIAKPGSEETELIFYQWVVFMLVINAILFKLPHLIWKSYEGGIMNAFFSGKNLKSKLLSEDETNQNIDFDMFYYNKLKGQNGTYYFIFQLCQLLNIGMLILNWWATDAFLGGNFHSYGTDVIDYYSNVENSYVASETSVRFDPMCNAFPTKTGCTIKTGGTAGHPTTTEGFCILTQNIINEKIYLFLWFWFVLMFVVSALQMIFEIAIFAIPSFRSMIIARQTGAYSTGEMKKYIEQDCNHGDWFILHQIGKNTNKNFFYQLVKNLSSAGGPTDNGETENLLPEHRHLNENSTLEMEILDEGKK